VESGTSRDAGEADVRVLRGTCNPSRKKSWGYSNGLDGMRGGVVRISDRCAIASNIGGPASDVVVRGRGRGSVGYGCADLAPTQRWMYGCKRRS